MPRFNFWTVVMILTWILLFVLLFIPVGSVLVSSFYDQAGNPTLANYLKFLGERRFHQAFINTLVVGGFGSLPGAIVGGVTIGIVESLSGFYLPDGFKDTAAYIVVLLMLMVRPNGLFGERLRNKV